MQKILLGFFHWVQYKHLCNRYRILGHKQREYVRAKISISKFLIYFFEKLFLVWKNIIYHLHYGFTPPIWRPLGLIEISILWSDFRCFIFKLTILLIAMATNFHENLSKTSIYQRKQPQKVKGYFETKLRRKN